MRRISTGTTGRPILGSASVSENVVTTLVTNQDLNLDPNGTGNVVVSGNVVVRTQGQLNLNDSDNSNSIGLRAPTNLTANVTYTLPGSGITNGYALVTDSSGNLSWSNIAVGVTDASSASTAYYPLMVTTTSGSITSVSTSSSTLSFVPNTGTLTATKYVETSSMALKENFTPITGALDKILSLQAWIYDRKDGSQYNEPGLVAEEVDPIIPNVVEKDANGKPMGINYTRLSAYLIESIKTLKSEIEELQKR